MRMEPSIVRTIAIVMGEHWPMVELLWQFTLLSAVFTLLLATSNAARDAERELLSKGLTDDVIDRAAMAATSALNPHGDFRGSAEYRTEMARVLTARALRTLRG